MTLKLTASQYTALNSWPFPHSEDGQSLPAIIAAYRSALIQQRAWIAHWQADIAAGLKPTEGSLSDARAAIEAVLTEKEKA